MLDYLTIQKFDPQGMHKIYDDWHVMAKKSYDANSSSFDFKDIEHIIFAGMGGSGTIGDILSSILSETSLHTSVIKGYHLPKSVNKKTLVVVTSISGNSVEPLSILESTIKTNCKTVSFCSGGNMEEFCKKHNIPYKNIKQIHSPRVSLPTYLYSMLTNLSSVIPIKKEDIVESITQLENLKKQIGSQNLSETNSSLTLANWIKGIPLIYYPWGLQSVAIRFKNSLNENAKLHVITDDVVEACHNSIVSWEKSSNVQPILIQGTDDYIKTKQRWKILEDYFEQKKIDFKKIQSVKGGILSKIINLIYLTDYCSIYYAIKNGIDPSPVYPIDFVKKHL